MKKNLLIIIIAIKKKKGRKEGRKEGREKERKRISPFLLDQERKRSTRGKITSMDSGGSQTVDQNWPLSLTSWLTGSKFLSFSEPWFPHLSIVGREGVTFSKVVVRIK